MPEPEAATQLDLQALSDETPFHRAMAVRLERSESGVILRASLDSSYAVGQDGTTAHGGIVASLLDSAATFALIAKTNQDWVTVDLRVDYLRPTGLGKIIVRGEVLYAGRSLGRSRAELRDETGRTTAIATGTFAPVTGR